MYLLLEAAMREQLCFRVAKWNSTTILQFMPFCCSVVQAAFLQTPMDQGLHPAEPGLWMRLPLTSFLWYSDSWGRGKFVCPHSKVGQKHKVTYKTTALQLVRLLFNQGFIHLLFLHLSGADARCHRVWTWVSWLKPCLPKHPPSQNFKFTSSSAG